MPYWSRYLFIMLFHCYLCFPEAIAQKEYKLKQFTIQDGLPSGNIGALCEDKLGYLWIGTSAGLVRYDGESFTSYNEVDGLIDNLVYGITVDNNNHLWLATSSGISKFDGKQFSNYQIIEEESNALDNLIVQIVSLNDTIFFLTAQKRLGKIFDNELFYPIYDKSQDVRKIITTGDNLLVYGSKLHLYSTNNVSEFSELKFNRLFKIIKFQGKDLLSTDQGLFEIIGNDSIKRIDLEIKQKVILYTEMDSSFWIVPRTPTTGLFKIGMENPDDKVEFDRINSPISESIIDSEGNIWVATVDKGLWRISLLEFKQLAKGTEIADKSIRSILVHDNLHWIGTFNNGIFLLYNDTIKSHLSFLVQGKNFVNSIRVGLDQNVYICTNHGIGVFNKKGQELNWISKVDGLYDNIIGDIVFDSNGDIYACGMGPAISLIRKDKVVLYSPDSEDAFRKVRSMKIWHEKNLILLGTDHGLFQFDIDSKQFFKFDIPYLKDKLIMSIEIVDDDRIALGTWGLGVIFYNISNSQQDFLIDQSSGLFSNNISFVKKENEFIWVGTDKGINRISILNSGFSGIKSFNHHNGFEGVACNTNSFWFGNKRKLFGSVEGLFEFNELPNRATKSHKLHMRDIKITDESFEEYIIDYSPNESVTSFSPGIKSIQFQFSRIDKFNSKNIKYRYLLEGQDTKWSNPSILNYANFTNLPPGNFTFRIQATDRAGSWGEDELTYTFTILTPFYKKPLFIIICIVALIAIVLIIFYLRMEYKLNQFKEVERVRAEEQNKLRKEIGRDFHDEIGNELAKIINYVDMIRLSNGSTPKPLLDKVEFSARYLYTGARDFLWSLDTNNNDVEGVMSKIRDFGEKLFQEKDINFRIFNTIQKDCQLQQGVGREVILIFKEAMTNAFQHAKASNVNLYFDQTKEQLSIIMEDDGIGFNIDNVKQRGLRNMQIRSKKIGAILEFSQGIGLKGSKVIFSMEMKKDSIYNNLKGSFS